MALMRKFIPEIKMSKNDGNGFARSILTTDTKTKEISVNKLKAKLSGVTG